MDTLFRRIAAGVLLVGATVGARAQALPPLAPLFDYPVRDTCVCLGPDGTYYLTGTTGHPSWWNTNDGIRMWKSTDQVTWEDMGLVWSFAQNKTWQQQGAIWAPEIHYIKGTFWLAYSLNYGGTGLLKSTSGNPEGPYVDIKTDGPLTSDIDASLFEDDDGKVYFIYQNGRIARMNDEMTGLAEAPRHLAPSNAGQVGFEGAFITKTGSTYLLVCAEFNYDSGSSTYDCMVASSTNIYGPYGDRYLSIRHGGHNMFFKDQAGAWWSTFFGNDDTAPFKERPALLRIGMNAQGLIYPLEHGGGTTNSGTNLSFENPVTETSSSSLTGWAKVGSGFTATVRNGSYGATIVGINGTQFADIDGNVVGTGIYQDLTLPYTVGCSYLLTVDVATRQDCKVTDGSMLRLSLRDTSGHVAAYTDVSGSQVNSVGPAIVTVTVTLPTVQNTDAWAEQAIRIWFENKVASGQRADWVVDNVRLTAITGNLAPVITEAKPVAVTMSEDNSPVPFSLTLHAADAETNTLTWSISTPASHGTATASGTGTNQTVAYTPSLNYNGADSFTVRVADNNGGADTITVNVTITPVQDPPVALAQSVRTLLGTAKAVTFAGSDPDGDTLSYAIVSDPAHGTLSGTPPAVIYTPADGYVGADTFTFKVNDGITNSAPAPVTVAISATVLAEDFEHEWADNALAKTTNNWHSGVGDTSSILNPEVGYDPLPSGVIHPLAYDHSAQRRLLKLNTGGDMLLTPDTDAAFASAKVYVDMLANFDVRLDFPEAVSNNVNAKTVIFLKADGASTNLYVLHGQREAGAFKAPTFTAVITDRVEPGTWHRLTVTLDSTTNGTGAEAFCVLLDGKSLVSSKAYSNGWKNRVFAEPCGPDGGTWFLSASRRAGATGTNVTSLARLGFEGGGFIDDLAVTYQPPIFSYGTILMLALTDLKF